MKKLFALIICFFLLSNQIFACSLQTFDNVWYCPSVDDNGDIFSSAYIYEAETVICVFVDKNGMSSDCHIPGHYLPGNDNWHSVNFGFACILPPGISDPQLCGFFTPGMRSLSF